MMCTEKNIQPINQFIDYLAGPTLQGYPVEKHKCYCNFLYIANGRIAKSVSVVFALTLHSLLFFESGEGCVVW